MLASALSAPASAQVPDSVAAKVPTWLPSTAPNNSLTNQRPGYTGYRVQNTLGQAIEATCIARGGSASVCTNTAQRAASTRGGWFKAAFNSSMAGLGLGLGMSGADLGKVGEGMGQVDSNTKYAFLACASLGWFNATRGCLAIGALKQAQDALGDTCLTKDGKFCTSGGNASGSGVNAGGANFNFMQNGVAFYSAYSWRTMEAYYVPGLVYMTTAQMFQQFGYLKSFPCETSYAYQQEQIRECFFIPMKYNNQGYEVTPGGKSFDYYHSLLDAKTMNPCGQEIVCSQGTTFSVFPYMRQGDGSYPSAGTVASTNGVRPELMVGLTQYPIRNGAAQVPARTFEIVENVQLPLSPFTGVIDPQIMISQINENVLAIMANNAWKNMDAGDNTMIYDPANPVTPEAIGGTPAQKTEPVQIRDIIETPEPIGQEVKGGTTTIPVGALGGALAIAPSGSFNPSLNLGGGKGSGSSDDSDPFKEPTGEPGDIFKPWKDWLAGPFQKYLHPTINIPKGTCPVQKFDLGAMFKNTAGTTSNPQTNTEFCDAIEPYQPIVATLAVAAATIASFFMVMGVRRS